MRALIGVVIVLAVPSFTSAVETMAQPLVVDSRDDWVRFGFPGTGTKDDPFIVDGLRFDLDRRSPGPAVSITNVPDYAEIHHVLVVGGRLGFRVADAPNVHIDNVTVRRSGTGFDVAGATLRNITAVESDLGVRATKTTIIGGYLADNGRGIVGKQLTIADTVLERNSIGVVIEADTATSSIRRVTVSGSVDAAIDVLGPLSVTNSTLQENVVGLRYAGDKNSVTVKGSNFGNHTDAAIAVTRTSTGTWKLDARTNFWGIGPDGKAAKPSPEGYGAPIEGPIEYAPVATTEYDDARPEEQYGARYVNTTGPNVTDAGTLISRNAFGVLQLSINLRIEDTDGIANWTLEVGDERQTTRLEGARSTPVSTTFDLPAGSTNGTFYVTSSDMFGNIGLYNATFEEYVPPPPPPPDAQGNETPAPPQEESPAAAWFATAGTLASLALVRRRRLS